MTYGKKCLFPFFKLLPAIIFSIYFNFFTVQYFVVRVLFPVKSKEIKGLIHAETMSAMILGSPIFSKSRFFNRKVVFFTQWEDEDYLNDFLELNSRGK